MTKKRSYIDQNRKTFALILLLLLIIPILSLIRIINPSEIDDVNPAINCTEIQKYDPDVLWIIPKYNNISITNNQTWCKEILALNKTLGLHGYMHTYEEFGGEIDYNQIEDAIKIFEACFGHKPTMFKPPQDAITRANEEILEKQYNLSVKKEFHQVTRKVYHCNDTGRFSNELIHWF